MSKAVGEAFKHEFSELLPRRIQFPEENDLLLFEFTSEIADLVARYIIGLAAALSGDVDFAEQMYNDLAARLKNNTRSFPVIEKIRSRLPLRIFEIHEARANSAYDGWRQHKTRERIATLGEHLSKIPIDATYAKRILGLRALYAVVHDRDVQLARKFVTAQANKEDATWHFNMAFLDAYDGDLHKAIRHYRNGTTATVQPAVTSEIEEFLDWILREEPTRYQFHYCRGFFNWKVRGDLDLAEQDFSSFLAAATKDKFAQEQRLAEKWIVQIRNERAANTG